MRSGGRVTVTLNTKMLRPPPGADDDPPDVRLKHKLPDGSSYEVVPAWPTVGTPIIKDSTGDFHYDTDPNLTPLDLGGRHEFVWKPGGGWPEAVVWVEVEASEW